MNMIPDTRPPALPATTFMLEERHATATGVERTVAVEPAGINRDQAWQVMYFRVTSNPAVYGPHTGIRLALVEGGAR